MIINIQLKNGESALLDCNTFHYVECTNEFVPVGRWFINPSFGSLDPSIYCKEAISCNDIYQITIADLTEQQCQTSILAHPWKYMHHLNKILINNPMIRISFISDKDGLEMVYDHSEIQSDNTGEEAVTDRQSEEIAEKVKKKK